MSQALYEQYKEALRRGHVASLRGRLDEAVAAYRQAATIAPDRALPHASLGAVLYRLGEPEAALAAFGVALERAPGDEAALRGRAELHADAGRRVEAALDYERLAALLDEAGRLADACDAARRALELAESRSRRREVERLAAQMRELGGDATAVAAMDRALHVLDATGAVSEAAPISPVADAAGPAADAAEPLAEAATGPATETGGRSLVPPGGPAASVSLQDPAILRAVADALLDSGDLAGGAQRLLQLAALHRAAGRHDAAMDACLALLAASPSDPRLHLEIAAIQLERGWTGIAAEKLRLLRRLVELDGDPGAKAAVAAFVLPRGREESPSPDV